VEYYSARKKESQGTPERKVLSDAFFYVTLWASRTGQGNKSQTDGPAHEVPRPALGNHSSMLGTLTWRLDRQG
jgi:hypothetical protein